MEIEETIESNHAPKMGVVFRWLHFMINLFHIIWSPDLPSSISITSFGFDSLPHEIDIGADAKFIPPPPETSQPTVDIDHMSSVVRSSSSKKTSTFDGEVFVSNGAHDQHEFPSTKIIDTEITPIAPGHDYPPANETETPPITPGYNDYPPANETETPPISPGYNDYLPANETETPPISPGYNDYPPANETETPIAPGHDYPPANETETPPISPGYNDYPPAKIIEMEIAPSAPGYDDYSPIIAIKTESDPREGHHNYSPVKINNEVSPSECNYPIIPIEVEFPSYTTPITSIDNGIPFEYMYQQTNGTEIPTQSINRSNSDASESYRYSPVTILPDNGDEIFSGEYDDLPIIPIEIEIPSGGSDYPYTPITNIDNGIPVEYIRQPTRTIQTETPTKSITAVNHREFDPREHQRPQPITEITSNTPNSPINTSEPKADPHEPAINSPESKGDPIQYHPLMSTSGMESVPDPPKCHCPPMRSIKTKLIPYTEELVNDVNVILVTATEVEFRAVMGQAKPIGTSDLLYQIDYYRRVTFFLGMYGLNKVAIIWTESGARETRMMLTQVQEAIKAGFVISVGICYGMKPDDLKLGDIIVARHIMDLSNRYATTVDYKALPIGDKCGKELYNIFRQSLGFELQCGDGCDDYVEIKSGMLVSETTLVADETYKDQILKQIPQALGGEMEGVGIMEAADNDNNLQGIVVKSVADWGNENKIPYKKWQEFAAFAAANYILFHLERSYMGSDSDTDYHKAPLDSDTDYHKVPDYVQKYRDCVRNLYKRNQMSASNWPYNQHGKQHFGKLTLKDKNENKRSSMLRDTGNMPAEVEIRELDDLIKPSESLRIVIDGSPGIGKTTLCYTLLNMWATKEQFEHEYDLVLYCPLKDDSIAEANKLADLLNYRCPEVSKVIEWMEEEHGKGVLILFDGWDELRKKHKRFSLPAEIIQKKRLEKCSVLITSRIYATSSLLSVTLHHRHFQIMGFSLDEIKTVVRGTLEESNQANKLISDLEVRTDVLSLCYIPLVLRMIIYIATGDKLQGQLPKTLTKLYKKFILQTIRRHIDINNDTCEAEDICGLDADCLPTNVALNFKELCKFAYQSMKGEKLKIVFTSLECQQQLKQAGYLGLINDYGEKNYQFLHLRIQEFLASWWVAKYEEEKRVQIFIEHFAVGHFKMCLRFLAGLTKLKPNDKYQGIFREKLDLPCERKPFFKFDYYSYSRMCHQNYKIRIDKYDNNHIRAHGDTVKSALPFQLLHESQNEGLCSTLAESMKCRSLCLRNLKLSIVDIVCVGYFLNNSNITWDHLDMGRLDEQQVQLLNNAFTKHKYIDCKVLEIEFYKPSTETFKLFRMLCFLQECYIIIRYPMCNSFLFLMKLLELHSHLTILHFSSSLDRDITPLNDEESTQMKQLLSRSMLKELVIEIGSDEDYSKALTSLLLGVETNEKIMSLTLELSECRLLSDSAISQLLSTNRKIRALSLNVPRLPLVETVTTPLTTLKLGGIHTSDQLTPFLHHIEGLKCLLLNSSYSPNLIFQSHPYLEQLEISIDTAEIAIKLFTILQENTTLKALRVKVTTCDSDIYTKMGNSTSLYDMLAKNQTIKDLEIVGDEFMPIAFLSHVTSGLVDNASLEGLSVPIPLSPSNNEQIDEFFNVVSKKKNLTELKVIFILDKLSDSSNTINTIEEKEQIIKLMYYKHSLESLTNVITSNSFMRMLDVKYTIKSDLSPPNSIEHAVEKLYQSIFFHSSLEYVGICGSPVLEDILETQKKALTKHQRKFLPIISLNIIT